RPPQRVGERVRGVGREHERPQAGGRAAARGRGRDGGLPDPALAGIEDRPGRHAPSLVWHRTGGAGSSPMLRSAPMRRVAFLLLFCVFGLVAAGCGSSDESVGALLSKTFGSNKAVKSGRVSAQVDANVQGVQGLNGLRLRLNGP